MCGHFSCIASSTTNNVGTAAAADAASAVARIGMYMRNSFMHFTVYVHIAWVPVCVCVCVCITPKCSIMVYADILFYSICLHQHQYNMNVRAANSFTILLGQRRKKNVNNNVLVIFTNVCDATICLHGVCKK